MARSRDKRRPPVGSWATPEYQSSATSGPPSRASATLPRVWQGVGYRPLPDATSARRLFDFAAVPWPETPLEFGWGAWTAASADEQLVGVVLAERGETVLMLHGPVVVGGPDPREIAAQLVSAALDHGRAIGAGTIFARPQGLDRIWVRFGFIPVPENFLPAALAGRPETGLYAWRGGSALWTPREAVHE